MNFMNLDIVFELFSTTSYDDNPPGLMDVLSENAGLLLLFGFLSLVSIIGLYGVWTKVFGKEKSWRGLIPFYNFFMLFRAIDLNPYLSFTIAIPVVGLVPLALFNFYLPRAFGLKGVTYGLAAVFMPWLMLILLAFDKKYEYQYVKGKNVPFKDSFRIPAPGEYGYGEANTPNEVGAIGSQISQAAALNMEKNEALRKEIAEREQEAAVKAEEERRASLKPATPTTEISYDIFDNGTIEPSEQPGETPPQQG